MAATPGSKSSTSKPAQRVRSEPQASGVPLEGEPAQRVRSEPQASGVPLEGEPAQVVIGRIAGAHGIRGWLRIAVFSDGSEALKPGTVVYLEGESEAGFEVRRAAPGRRGGEWRLALGGVESRDAAEALSGRIVSVALEALGSSGEDSVWGHELIGCAVEAEDGARLGRVREIWETGASDVLVVEAPDGTEHLLPAALLVEVDVAAQRAVVELLPGLVDPGDGK
ncbi:MAG TPA: ribosome maturation factor RimM [Myxococcota bacterium]|jgi:16S rRNA processing protein RimM|nr:ribosome maturation factor RimM [Myxococcota bacterium]